MLGGGLGLGVGVKLGVNAHTNAYGNAGTNANAYGEGGGARSTRRIWGIGRLLPCREEPGMCRHRSLHQNRGSFGGGSSPGAGVEPDGAGQEVHLQFQRGRRGAYGDGLAET